jgi:hypothetical protein
VGRGIDRAWIERIPACWNLRVDTGPEARLVEDQAPGQNQGRPMMRAQTITTMTRRIAAVVFGVT